MLHLLRRTSSESLYFGVLRLRLLQEWDVGVGVLPYSKKILIGKAGLRNIILRHLRLGDTEARQGAQGRIDHYAAMIQQFFEIHWRLLYPCAAGGRPFSSSAPIFSRQVPYNRNCRPVLLRSYSRCCQMPRSAEYCR